MNNDKKPNIKGILFLAFFVIMVIALIFTASKGYITAAIICFGILFLVLGLAACLSTKITLQNAPLLLFPIVGAGAVIIPLVKEFSDFTISADITVILVLGVFMLIGLGFLIIPAAIYIHKKKTCVPVMAVCKDLDVRYSRSKNGGRKKIYAPTWEYYFDGEFHTVRSNAYSNIDVPEIGGEYELYIDPNDPKKFYRPSMKTLIFFIVFGAVWTIMSSIPVFLN